MMSKYKRKEEREGGKEEGCLAQNEEVSDGWVGLLHDQLSKFIPTE